MSSSPLLRSLLVPALVASGLLAEDVTRLPVGDPARRDKVLTAQVDTITEATTGKALTPAELAARLAEATDRINKIIDTYQFRKEGQRYSRRVSMEEIEKNDFNLNISRYVSTAEAEEEIDLAAVHAELLSLELARKAALEKHNGFLKELGLPLLP